MLQAPKSGEPEFRDLWPTRLMRLSLPGANSANPLIEQVIEEMDAARDNLTTAYLDTDFFEHPHPATTWLRECCNRAALDYARSLGIEYELEWRLQAWPNVNRFGDYHNLHNHPHAWLSGAYYVSVPAPDMALKRGDLNPGAISFYDPRPQANMNAIKGDGQVDPEHRILPNPGDLLLWPAFLHHSVHPNLSQSPRMSVSFNVVLRWRDDYIP